MGEKGEVNMLPTPPKFGGRWWRVSHARRNEVRLGRTGLVTRTKKITKTKKKEIRSFFCKNGLGGDQTLRLPGKHQGLPFGPQIDVIIHGVSII